MREISPHAKRLRRDETDAEIWAWQMVRNRQIEGFKFRRQWTLGPYIVDFACLEAKLVVEIDGSQHSEALDAPRTRYLEGLGFTVLRFWNSDVMTNLEGVGEAIRGALLDRPTLTDRPSPNPLPQAGEG